jgi:hypothetical protein
MRAYASAFVLVVVTLGSFAACGTSPDHPAPLTGGGDDSGAVPLDTGHDVAADVPEVASHCANGKQDADETDLDCGGTCGGCVVGKKCALNADCVDMACSAGTCVTPSCTDKVLDGTETDVDCGGPSCSPCADGLKCTINESCKSLVCKGGKCSAPSCTDGVRNGTESDADCGGTCPKCTVGKRCGAVADCGSGFCAGVCGCPAGMVIMPTKATGGGAYCIDAHEVSTSAYNAFWTAAVSAATQPAFCSWNDNWTPSQSWPPAASDTLPVRYVDWCDAYAFCKWDGKTLCGKIGGGANAAADLADPLKSAWFNACSAQQTNAFPTGMSFDAVACNGENAKPDVWSTGVTTCQGGATGLYDMAGNVQEWEDSCDTSAGKTDACRVRGGGFDTATAAALQCDAPTKVSRGSQLGNLGFRCCAFF